MGKEVPRPDMFMPEPGSAVMGAAQGGGTRGHSFHMGQAVASSHDRDVDEGLTCLLTERVPYTGVS